MDTREIRKKVLCIFLSKSVDEREQRVYIKSVPDRERLEVIIMTINLKRLKAERIAKGMTQDQMAEKMGWKTRTPYAKRENGVVSIGADELARMAVILGYSLDELKIFFTKIVPEKERNVS